MPFSLPDNPLKLFPSARVLVVGDTMLDRYWFGDVERISPEAPVPVAKIERMDQRAGGAGNVARNIASLGGQVGLLSIVGQDEAARELENIIQSNGVQTFLQRDPDIATTVKLRVLSRNQQLLRIDFEEKPGQNVLGQLNRQFRSLLPDYDAVILSDYGKGCLHQVADMIDFARAHRKPVLIDPKGDDYEKYAGAHLITPNRSELRQVVGAWRSEAELTEKAEALRRHLQLSALLLTRSEEGMSLYEPDHISHQPTRAQEVFDVSGAGDTVIATMGLALAAKLNLRQAMHIANAAAGVVVAKLGTAVCSRQELETALQQDLAAE
ncbi:D-glycero-beta-D-manno-heptose-7-phosphate kinase [Eikenella sp. S3360]|uniref:D-glycero-beta-D-manno-heptose-7-phosphate kinase n=1 Tax=Eikenella glucosivorans TaxID=2766967 RepID=A0ABS0N8Y2_9NEIS|nr:D-glycero-beta-D-manno-heptose-7-phosphate kinase [Eikenella glucosivorans]MBH5328735.1 D-glycero-beta-D-manno-heptose-7-phosphate kinase [Eikenella glucosivorans]